VTDVTVPVACLLFGHQPFATVETRKFVRWGTRMSVVALVVDDSMVIRHTICRFLEDHGFGVESASNGIEALEILERVLPGLIITDMQMPVMGGSELISAIKSKPATAKIPIVIVTGRSSGYDRKEARAEFTIFKDIDIQEQLEKALVAIATQCSAKGHASGK
jgi:CheY-like chemotaxis protein